MHTIIDIDQLETHLDDPDWQVIDCRFSLANKEEGYQAYQDQHISGALYAHLNDQLSGAVIAGKTGRHPLPEKSTWIEQVLSWGIKPSKQVIAYDDMGGAFAARLWWLLRWIGHESVAVLDGGWQAWQNRHLPTDGLIPGLSRNNPGKDRYDGLPEQTRQADVEQVMKADSLLLDARDEARYRGEVEPIDPVAGHIPGAICVPFSDNLTQAGTFKSKQELQRRFAAILAGSEHQSVICYCGSGVTATHNILAMVHAGLREPMLYPGSWSEYVTDPDRPIAT